MATGPYTGKPAAAPKKYRLRRFVIVSGTLGLVGLGVYASSDYIAGFRKAAIDEVVGSAIRPEQLVCTGINKRTGKPFSVYLRKYKEPIRNLREMDIVVKAVGSIDDTIAESKRFYEGPTLFQNRVKRRALKICGKKQPQY